MNDEASVIQNATAALVGAIAGYLMHGHWPLQAAWPVQAAWSSIEAVIRWLLG